MGETGYGAHTRLQRELGAYYVDEVRQGRMTRRDLVRRGSVIGLSATLLGTLLAACGGGGSSTQAASGTGSTGGGAPSKGGTLRIGVQQPPAAVDPLTNSSKGGSYTLGPALAMLTSYNEQYEVTPQLAESWKPDSSGRTWTFKLRDTKWQDGKPFTADDVVYSLRTALDPKNPSPTAAAFSDLVKRADVEKVDGRTVRFHLSRPYVDFPYTLGVASYIVPDGYEEGSFAKGGVGIGPFKLVSYNLAQGAVYTASPTYWAADRVYLDGINLRYYDSDQTTVIALQGGEIDLIPVLAHAATGPLGGASDIQLLSSSSSQYEAGALRTDIAPFKDRRVRQALALSLDRPAIVKTLFGDAAELGNDNGFAPVFPLSDAVVKQVAQRQRDLEQAKGLLSQAGHSNGLDVTLTTEQYLEIPQYAQLIQSQAKDAGFNIKLNVLPQSKYYGTGSNQPWLSVPFGITDFAERSTPSLTMTVAYTSGAPFNSSHWSNKQFDSLLRQMDSTLDEGKRSSIAVQAGRLMTNETPALITYWIKQQRAHSSKVHGFPAGPASRLELEGVWIEH